MKTLTRSIPCILLLHLITLTASAFYNPTKGCWINRDPIEENGAPNLFLFVRQDPILLVDVFGLHDTNGGVIDVPDLILGPNPQVFYCPTPLEDVHSFVFYYSVCDGRCARQRTTISGSYGECYDPYRNYLGRVVTGLSSTSVISWNLFCCCGRRGFSGFVQFDDERFTFSGRIRRPRLVP